MRHPWVVVHVLLAMHAEEVCGTLLSDMVSLLYNSVVENGVQDSEGLDEDKKT